jgi:tetratricopeptide (TPR) repeat protein
MKRTSVFFATACLAVWAWPGAARARSSPESSSQESSSKKSTGPPADAQDSSSKPSNPPKGTQPAPAPAPDGSDAVSRRINNSAPAQHDVEVGQYYMKKEKYDAAIDRFTEATKLMPEYGLPYKLMGEAYEKKKFLPEARQAYQKYLACNISSKESEEIQKRVARLDAEIQDQERRRAEATKP